MDHIATHDVLILGEHCSLDIVVDHGVSSGPGTELPVAWYGT